MEQLLVEVRIASEVAIDFGAVLQKAWQDVFNIIYWESIVSIEVLNRPFESCALSIP